MNPLLTIIIPVYNEASTIDELLSRVVQTDQRKEIIVVNDGSTDETSARLDRWMQHVAVFTHAKNRGKGAGIRTGLIHAQGEFTLIQDADLEYDPKDYSRLLAPLVGCKADVVYGSRYLCSRQPWSVCRSGVALLNCVLLRLYGVRLTDEATCYKVFRTFDLKAMKLECDGFEFCPEVTAKACRMGLSILEVPISYRARTVADGKKIRWRDGVAAVRTLWCWRKWQPALLRRGPTEEPLLHTATSTNRSPARTATNGR